MPTVQALESIPERAQIRFWKYVRTSPDDNCWGWDGGKFSSGYGRLSVTFARCICRVEYAHRISYVIHHGAIPAGMVVMHDCDNPLCTNPRHLKLGTHLDNMRDRDRKGRDKYSRGYAKPIGISGYRGVQPSDKRWMAKYYGRYLGLFDTAEEAARAYDAEAIESGRVVVRLNFPSEHEVGKGRRIADAA